MEVGLGVGIYLSQNMLKVTLRKKRKYLKVKYSKRKDGLVFQKVVPNKLQKAST